ncbi:hypothetical protein PRIPAC_77769 [Pristionchus pacificus]|nr:hypothetical protein PRIPAC_77769 [Pristionchus pacificus]|eukprot:PDM75565.1 membrane transporter [Pristionchus pacificus]
MKFDELLFSHLGEMGKYQKIQFVLVCLPCIFCAMHSLSWTFTAVGVTHRCAVENETKYSPYWAEAASEHINITSSCVDDKWNPVDPSDPSARCLYESCTYSNNQSCSSYVFDNSHVRQSAMGRWDICFFVAIALQILCGFVQSVAPTWWLYALVRAGTGFSHPGASVISVVIGTELMGPKYRKLASICTALCMALGQCILGTVAMFLTDYQWLHVALTAPSLLFISYWWLIHESTRWLVSIRRFDKADHILQKAAKTNGVTLPDQWWNLLDGEEKTEKKERKEEKSPANNASCFDLLRTPVLRRRSLVVFYLWPVVSMVYYGLSMKSDILGGDLYVNFIIGGLIEMPALLLVYLLLDRVGRRPIIVGGYMLTGVCLLSNLLISKTAPRYIAILQLLASRGAISATYTGIYAFTPELFPTTVRNTGMGLCSTIARVGAISASYICFWIADRYGKAWMIIPFGGMSILAAVLILIFLPETMGKPLPSTIEEIEGSTSDKRESELDSLTETPSPEFD